MNRKVQGPRSKAEGRNRTATVICAIVVLCILGMSVRPASAETIRSKDVEVTVRRDGCGLIDEVKYKGEVVMSAAASGHTPTPGFRVDAKRAALARDLILKLGTLKADAPCKVTESTSARGHKLVTLENGLVKVTALTWFGGRVIRLESRLTGANLLDDPYEDRPDEVKDPKELGGIWGELPDKIFHPQVVTQTDDEVAVTLTGEGDGRKIEKTLRLKRGSAVLEIEQKQLNPGDARDATNHLNGRFRVGTGTGPEDVLWGSSRGRATYFWRTRSSPNCHTDPGTDHWAAVCDTTEGVTLLSVFDGPVVRVGTWIRPEFYQLEFWTPNHFTLDAGGTMTTKVRLAACFNLDGVAFANDDLALGIVPESEVIGAAAKAWRTTVTAVGLSNGRRTLTLKAHVTDRHGRTVKDLPPATVACPFLVAVPREVSWPVDGLPAGVYDLHVAVEADGKKLGETVLAFRRLGAGPLLEVFRPVGAEVGNPFPVLGTVEPGKVEIASVARTDGKTIRVTGKHVLATSESPFTTEVRLNDAGDGFDISHTVVCNVETAAERVRALGLELPLTLGSDYCNVRTTVGGGRLNDAWRVDQTDERIYTPTVSDYFSRWPLWKLGGVLQDAPTHYRIWKASDWDVAPMTTLEGNAAPGWVELNNRKHGIRIEMPDMAAKAPKEILVDAYAGTARVYFFPPHVPPIRLAGSGDPRAPTLADRLNWRPGAPWTNTVSVKFHAGPHLRGFKRDLSDDAFRAVLQALGDPTVPRSMSAFALPGGSFEECVQNLLDSDLTVREYVRRAVGDGYRLPRLCQGVGSKYTRGDYEQTI
ncbi:MAG TPA: hypothetical protein VMZ92_11480, partial [Planctomycetota bacterium]|nr:hypothetical protein [Planctomycetota bacterium]